VLHTRCIPGDCIYELVLNKDCRFCIRKKTCTYVCTHLSVWSSIYLQRDEIWRCDCTKQRTRNIKERERGRKRERKKGQAGKGSQSRRKRRVGLGMKAWNDARPWACNYALRFSKASRVNANADW